MIKGDRLIIASENLDCAMQYGEDKLLDQSGCNIFYAYAINTHGVRGSSLMENVQLQSRAAIANLWSRDARPIDIAEGAGEYQEVHLDNTQIDIKNISYVKSVERWVPHPDL